MAMEQVAVERINLGPTVDDRAHGVANRVGYFG